MSSEMFSPGFSRIVKSDATLEKISGGHIFTEGPVWNNKEHFFVWTDIIDNKIWKWTPGKGAEIIMHPSGKADGMCYDHDGRLLVAGWSSRTVWRWEHDGSTTVLASHVDGKKLNTPNDIIMKSDGVVYFTDPSNGIRNVGMESEDVQKYVDYEAVYKLDLADGSLTLLADDYVNCNGLCFSPDESLLYINDTARRHIRVYDVLEDGNIGDGRLFAELFHDDHGAPDGMKVDVEGNVYCTGPGGVWVTDPQGNHLGRLLVPEDCANFGFGDPDYRTIYFTARSSIYRMRVEIPGLPTYPIPGISD